MDESKLLEPALPPTDSIFELMERFARDVDDKKVDLAPGVYRTEEGQPWVLPSVQQASIELLGDPSYNHEYLPIKGLPAFVKAAEKLVFGNVENIASVQVLSGTGGNHIAALYLASHHIFRGDAPTSQNDIPIKPIYIPRETWFNHYDVYRHAGLFPLVYPYWDEKQKTLDKDRMLQTMEGAPNGSVFCLHACGHNPTGVDPSEQTWRAMSHIFKRKNHFALFDAAYLGFVSGDIIKDKMAIDIFYNAGISMAVAVGFGKTTGLYSERVGSLHFTCKSPGEKSTIEQQLCLYSRWETSGAPAFGAHIIARILNNAELRSQWDKDLMTMATRIEDSRKRLYSELLRLETPGDWSHIISQRGMFSYIGLTAKQCNTLLEEHHIYLPHTGRISMSGINPNNVAHVAKTIDLVVRKC